VIFQFLGSRPGGLAHSGQLLRHGHEAGQINVGSHTSHDKKTIAGEHKLYKTISTQEV